MLFPSESASSSRPRAAAFAALVVALAVALPARSPQPAPPPPRAAPIPVPAPVGGRPGNVAVTPADGRTYQQPSIAVDPRDPARVAIAMQVVEAGQPTSCAVGVSADGGRSWRTSILVGPGGRFGLPEGMTACQQPVMEATPDGTFVVAYMASLSSVYGNVYLTASRDGGRTFARPALVDPSVPPMTSECCGSGDWFPALGAAPPGGSGQVFVAWVRYDQAFTRGPVLLARCRDEALSALLDGDRLRCDRPARVNPPYQPTGQKPIVAAGPEGEVTVAWQDISELLPSGFAAPIAMFAATSRDGRSFRAPVLVDPDVETGCAFGIRVACDPAHYNGTILGHSLAREEGVGLLWAWFEPSDRGNRIVYSTSGDGRRWDRPDELPRAPKRGHQHRPAVSSTTGRLDVAYYLLGPDLSQHVYWVGTSDPGSAFSRPLRVTTKASDARVGPPSQWGTRTASFGDSPAVASAGNRVLVAWTDTRRAGGRPRQDVYFAAFDVDADSAGKASDGDRAPGAAPLVAVLVVGLLLAVGFLVLVLRRRPSREEPSPGR